MTKPFEFWN